ncbi:hypothetical protein [Dyadobacter sp. BHUBP1]|uniref:hypothetical protein n=1 Tax=Dyadobacter sp. BHUBP1 TaxID=3424178 RepID=UPI003D34867D
MELSEEAFHEIHQYLNGEGTPEARADFEKRMQADGALAHEVAMQRRIRNGLKANEYRNLFRDIHAELQREGMLANQAEQDDQKKGKIVPLLPESRFARRWPYVAAVASIFVVAGLLWYFNSQPESTPIASDTPVAEKPAAPDTLRPAPPAAKPESVKTTTPKSKKPQPTPANTAKRDFFAEYFNEKPTLESPFSKEKLGLSPSAFRQWQSDTAHVHQGVRFLGANNAALALQELELLETSRFPQVKGTAEWYIALAYLQQNDLKNCVEQLKKVAADAENPNNKQAAELLAKMQ